MFDYRHIRNAQQEVMGYVHACMSDLKLDYPDASEDALLMAAIEVTKLAMQHHESLELSPETVEHVTKRMGGIRQSLQKKADDAKRKLKNTTQT